MRSQVNYLRLILKPNKQKDRKPGSTFDQDLEDDRAV